MADELSDRGNTLFSDVCCLMSFASKVIYSPSFDVNISISKAASSDAADFRCKACLMQRNLNSHAILF